MKDRLGFIAILMRVFTRLPCTRCQTKWSTSTLCSPSPLGVYDSEIRGRINDWVEDQMAQIELRKRKSGDDPVQKHTLTLFRYLTVRSRVINPYTVRGSYRLDSDLNSFLEQSICDSLAHIIDVADEIERQTSEKVAVDEKPTATGTSEMNWKPLVPYTSPAPI